MNSTAFEIVNGTATFIRPFCGVNPASGSAVCWKIDAGASGVVVYDSRAEISNDAGQFLVDTGSWGAETFINGQAFFYGTGGTSGAPIPIVDLSAMMGVAWAKFYDTSFSISGGYKSFALNPSASVPPLLLRSSGMAANILFTGLAGNVFLGDNGNGFIANWHGYQVDGVTVLPNGATGYVGNYNGKVVLGNGTAAAGSYVDGAAGTWTALPVNKSGTPTVGAGVCWKTSSTLGTCTAGTWPNCSTCN